MESMCEGLNNAMMETVNHKMGALSVNLNAMLPVNSARRETVFAINRAGMFLTIHASLNAAMRLLWGSNNAMMAIKYNSTAATIVYFSVTRIATSARRGHANRAKMA